MDTPKLRDALDKRIDEIGKIPDVIDRTTAASELLSVLDTARVRLAQAYSGT